MEGDGVFHPPPDEFSEIVMREIRSALSLDRIIIQSFDFRVLKYLHGRYPNVKLAVLIENLLSPENNFKTLGFTPAIYSPYYKLVSPQLVEALRGQRVKLIPWTVNEVKDMKRLIQWGVDGIITDYPDRARQFLKQQ